MLLITVATMALPFSRPAAFQCRAHIRSTASPSTMRPCGVDENRPVAIAIERHAHPAAKLADRARESCSGCVDPQSRLMFRPSGCALSTCTSNPSSRNSLGATVVVAPFAVSIAILKRPSRSGSGSASRACAI